jgi:hypothetical protein
MTFFCLFCRSDSLPLEEIKDVYLLDFVGPPGFVEDIAPKVERHVSICSPATSFHIQTELELLCVSKLSEVTSILDFYLARPGCLWDVFSSLYLNPSLVFFIGLL